MAGAPSTRYQDLAAVHDVDTVDGQSTVLPKVTVIEPEAWPSDVKAPDTWSADAKEDADAVNAPSAATAELSIQNAVNSPRHGAGNDTCTVMLARRFWMTDRAR